MNTGALQTTQTVTDAALNQFKTKAGNVVSAVLEQVIKSGKEEINKLYPRDFEVYMCALELVDDNGGVVDYFAFPIMPKSISKTETEATSMQTSLSGVTVFNKQGYTPDELSIQGDFGRSFKLISFEQDNYFKAITTKSIESGYYSAEDINSRGAGQKVKTFPYGVKSGYGCAKILQSIIHKARAFGQTGNTYRLYFHNPALGESYLVIPTKQPLTWSQNEGASNMIWQYTLNLIIIADLNDVVDFTPSEKKPSYTFSADKMLGGVAGTKSMVMSYRNLIVTKSY